MPQPYIDDYFELTFPTSSYHFLWVQAKGVPIPLGGCVCFAGFANSSPPASWSSEAFSLKKRNLLEGGDEGMRGWLWGRPSLKCCRTKRTHLQDVFISPRQDYTLKSKSNHPKGVWIVITVKSAFGTCSASFDASSLGLGDDYCTCASTCVLDFFVCAMVEGFGSCTGRIRRMCLNNYIQVQQLMHCKDSVWIFKYFMNTPFYSPC